VVHINHVVAQRTREGWALDIFSGSGLCKDEPGWRKWGMRTQACHTCYEAHVGVSKCVIACSGCEGKACQHAQQGARHTCFIVDNAELHKRLGVCIAAHMFWFRQCCVVACGQELLGKHSLGAVCCSYLHRPLTQHPPLVQHPRSTSRALVWAGSPSGASVSNAPMQATTQGSLS